MGVLSSRLSEDCNQECMLARELFGRAQALCLYFSVGSDALPLLAHQNSSDGGTYPDGHRVAKWLFDV